jgi:predicted house-cleaning NTP pyrophosphatase (Maf/HAM1 superfamily)
LSNISLLKPLIIATESEIRKKIFSDFNLNVSFIASEVDEDSIKENFQFKNYYDLAIELASAKALEISKKNPDHYVLGVDQVCEFNNEILNKPGNKEKCIKTLQKLSGNTHFQNCGMAIAFNDSVIWTSYDVAKLTMNELSLKDIEDDLYGYCETCGVEIGIKRLEARPTATQCIDCKTVDEIKEKQQFG